MCKKFLSIILLISLTLVCVFSPASSVFAEGELPDACITVPENVQLFVGSKPCELVESEWGDYLDYRHFVEFDEILPIGDPITDSGNTSYYFELDDDAVYNYRISSDEYITYAGTFTKTPDFNMTITEDILSSGKKTKTTVDLDTSSNDGHNVADIYLNINPQGYLKMEAVGDTYQLVPLRNWEAIDDTTNNYFIEPDFCYSVTDEDGLPSDSVISINESGVITALDTGIAIVLVTYNSMNLDFGEGKEFYGAIWPENTGVFVVSVGTGSSGISPNMTINEGLNNAEVKLSGDYIDAEHDVIYYIGDNGTYTFTPETEGCIVSVANPVIDNEMSFDGFEEVIPNDNSFDVPLTHGRNIVKIEKDGCAEYQIITAKQVSVTINNGKPVCSGDDLTITFDTLYHPAGKLAGVYNMSASAIYTDVSGYDDEIIGGLRSQYSFADSPDSQTISNVLTANEEWGLISYEGDTSLSVPSNYREDTFTLKGGMIYVGGWGDSFGNHRGITLTDGKAPNLNADAKMAWFGKLPDIEIPISRRSYSSSGGHSSSKNDTLDKNDTSEENTPPEEDASTDKTDNEEQSDTADKKTFSADTFDDINADSWYYDAVKYVYENNLMDGTGISFEPASTMSRAMLVTVLYRLADVKDTYPQNPFTDVKEGSWYFDAVKWAAANGIVNGISNTEFAPDTDITREQLAVILCRYAEFCSYDIQADASLTQFNDASDISDWAVSAAKWAVANELINGTADGTILSPKAAATRAEVAAIIMRYCKNFVAFN